MTEQTDNSSTISQQKHELRIDNLMVEKDKRFYALKYQDCASYHINIRTLEILKPLLNESCTWLTIGDYNGFEAKYFDEHKQTATATDVSDSMLIDACKEGYIKRFSKENVEHLSFADGSFDYVSCRESFHHFPRAYLGLYEMIRVAKKGVVLTEPIDILAKSPLLLLIKNIFDIFDPILINRIWKNRFSWETMGNYVFKISEREVEKIAMGIFLPCIAFKGVNMILNYTDDTSERPTNHKVLNKIIGKEKKLDLLCKLRLIPYNHLCSIIFNQTPDAQTLAELKKEGFTVIHLPPNPYL